MIGIIDTIIEHFLEIIVFAFVAWLVIKGFYDGASKVMLNLVTMGLAAAISTYLLPGVAKIIGDYTFFDELVRATMLKSIGLANIPARLDRSASQGTYIGALKTTAEIKKFLQTNNTELIWRTINALDFRTYASKVMGNIVLNLILFLILFGISYFALYWGAEKAKIKDKLPPNKGLAQLGGAILGRGQAMFILWLFSYALVALSGISLGQWVFHQFYKKDLLQWIFNNNLLDYIIRARIYVLQLGK